MEGFRARDADRDRYVEVIESAYVDGQLGDLDRELRVSRALSAETLDELESLTRDLQNRPVPVRVPVVPAPAAPAPVRSARPRRTGGLSGVGAAAAGAVLLAVVGTLMASTQESDWVGGSSTEIVRVPSPVPTPLGRDGTFSFSQRGVRELVAAYDARFPRDPYELTIFPRRAVAQVPLPGPGSRFQVWVWDGTWTRDGEPATLAAPRAPVDLAELDAGRLVDNVRLARDAVRVEDGHLGRVVLTRTGEEPALLTIRVTNRYGETGELVTTPAGEIVSRDRFRG